MHLGVSGDGKIHKGSINDQIWGYIEGGLCVLGQATPPLWASSFVIKGLFA